MANSQHLEILEKGVDTWNRWRKENSDVMPDLRGANLKGRNLVGADFSNADIRSCNFMGANLTNATLNKVNAGLQNKWRLFLIIISISLGGFTGIYSAFAGVFIGNWLIETSLNQYYIVVIAIVVLLIVCIITIAKPKVLNIECQIGVLAFIGAGYLTAMTFWDKSKQLNLIRADSSYLQYPQIRKLLVTGNGQNQNFDRLDLRGINLSNANLQKASFVGTDLSRANLVNANLSGAKLVQTLLEGVNLNKAKLTGACIADWGISSTTRLLQIECDFIHMKLEQSSADTNEYIYSDRHPADTKTNFKPGEFASLVGIVTDTVDLIFKHGIDWKAFLPTLQELQVKYQDEDLSIAAIEKKPDGAFVVRLNVSPYADKGEIESLTKQLYEEKLKLIEAQHRAELKSLETKYSIELSNKEEIIELHKKHYSDILELGKLAASRPIENDINFNPNLDLQVMSDSTGRQIKAKGDVVGNILGDSSTISGTVAKSIGQLPSSSDPNQPGIKELLEQLKNAHRYADLFEIATDSRLEEKQKEKLLKRVKNLADAALNPNDESLKDMAENAIEFLKNNLPPTAAAFTVGNRVLPAIAKILGF